MRGPTWMALVLCTALPAQAPPPQFQAAPLPVMSGWVVALERSDYDADGDDDVAVAAMTVTQIQVLTNDGLGHLGSTVLAVPWFQWLSALVFVDFDGDGDRDLFATWGGPTGANCALLRWTGAGWTSAAAPSMPAMTGLLVADLDGDGDQDIAGCGHFLGGGADGILRNQNGAFAWQPAFGGSAVTIGGADVDGDGDVDVATTSPLRLWRNDGGMSFTDVSATQLPPLPGYRARIAFGDVDGDGDLDLVLGDPVGPVDRLLRNTGAGTFVEVPGAIPGSVTASVALADVDEDGDLDLVRAGTPPTLCTNDGSGAYTVATSRWAAPTAAFGHALPVDLDRDGDLDVVLGGVLPATAMWNHHRHLKVPAPPVRGQGWTVELWGQPGYGLGTRAALLAIGLARLPQPVTVPLLGALWLDLAAPFVLQPALIAPPNSVAPLTFAIPNAQALAGVALHCQALVEEHAGVGDARLTALVSATIQ